MPQKLCEKDFLIKEDVKIKYGQIMEKLVSTYQKEPEKLKRLVSILQHLNNFSLGRFLIYNCGALSGYWTYYLITHNKSDKIKNPVKNFLLTQAPTVLATRERFTIFQNLLVKNIKDHDIICSAPCGVMYDLISLPFTKHIKNLTFIGIDWDEKVFETAKALIKKYKKSEYEFYFTKENIWNSNITEKFNVITSNGLNIYEPNTGKLIKLYKLFFQSLRPDGLLIGSALSPPELWDKKEIIMPNMHKQNEIFKEIMQATWQNYTTPSDSIAQLKLAGFRDIAIYWDKQKIFYTFLAKK